MSCCGYQTPDGVVYYLLCVDFQDPTKIPDWQPGAILKAENASWLESCCLCGVNLDNQIPQQPIPSVLQGVTYQGGERGEKRIQTLDYCEWDETTHSLISNQWGPGAWVGGYRNANNEWRYSLPWLCLSNTLGRLSRFSYHFRFNQELTEGDILPLCNPCVCVPCLEPWCYVPQFLLVYKMSWNDKDTEWNRVSYLGEGLSCCGTQEPHIYQLKPIIQYPGGIPSQNGVEWNKVQPGYDEMVLQAPPRVMCMR